MLAAAAGSPFWRSAINARRVQIRALTENNPELRNALTDPETIRQRCVRPSPPCWHASPPTVHDDS